MMRRYLLYCLTAMGLMQQLHAQNTPGDYHETYRPQVHFSPLRHWTNDPNGMVYENGTYHLFFQYYPGGNTWGPMHWGHATSTDLIHWQEQPIALYPDSLGYIFSGSAVVDTYNTSGFGKGGKAPLVAIFTHHDPVGEKQNKDNFQNQSIAYSLDHGRTWTKYKGNPVLHNPGIRDFRDPKVMWYAAERKWIMTLATKDRITFYASKDLKNWSKESEFGATQGAHGGVWECPDLFPLQLGKETYWVLLVNINPGGPNKGSATQYFVGRFDGHHFQALDEKIRWIDYGPDEYAGITWANTGQRKIFLGWMSNWLYANQVPTEKWRNAMTIPRELTLKKVNQELIVASEPVKELAAVKIPSTVQSNVKNYEGKISASSMLNIQGRQLQDFSIVFSNSTGEELTVGYESAGNRYFIDRTKSGLFNFSKDFSGKFYCPRFANTKSFDVKLLLDESSVELFADNGLSTMTGIFFPTKGFTTVKITSKNGMLMKQISIEKLKSIWN